MKNTISIMNGLYKILETLGLPSVSRIFEAGPQLRSLFWCTASHDVYFSPIVRIVPLVPFEAKKNMEKTAIQTDWPYYQIRIVAFMCTTVDTSFIFTKKSNVVKCYFDICNAEMVQWRQKSWNLDTQSQFSMSKNVRNFLEKKSIKNINLWPHFL